MNSRNWKQRSAVNKYFAAIFSFFFFVTSDLWASQPVESWLAFGDLRGYLEPCGCDPDADLGGVRRIRAALENERLQLSDGFDLLCLGNILPLPDAKADVKIPFLLRAIDEMQTNAILLNRLEITYWKKLPKKLVSELPFVLSNSNKFTGVKSSLTTNNSVIFGFVSPFDDVPLLPANSELFEKWKLQKRAAKNKSTILLFSGTDHDLQLIVQAKVFDTIIRSNTRSFATDPDLSESKNESLLYDKKTETWMVPVGGQGLLRGGRMVMTKAKSLSELVNGTECSPANFPNTTSSCESTVESGFPEAQMVTWLPRDIGGDQYFVEIFKDYASAAESAFNATILEREKMLKNSPYVGAEKCGTCHPEATKIWRNSAHGHAFSTLEKKHKDKDLECVSCHVVGAKVAGGFVSKAKSPHLFNVQCENCHGPGKLHAANPSVKLDQNARNCESCHHEPHTSTFEFNTYWKKIEHGKR